MKKIVSASLAIALVFVLNTEAQTSQPKHNKMDVHWYGLHISVDPSLRYIQAAVQSTFTLLEASREVVWDFTPALLVDSVIYNQQRISFSQQANNRLVAVMPELQPAGSSGAMTIYYHGIPPTEKIADNDSGFSFITARHKNQPVLFTVNEPFGAQQWWPCRNGLHDKPDSIDIHITHPSRYKASANGRLQSVRINGSSATTHFKHRYPVAAYLVAFAVSNYTVFERTALINGIKIPVITYSYPDQVKTFEALVGELVNAIELFSRILGPYPFMSECYAQTQVSGAGGMEHQTNSFVDGADLSLQNHELVHQWFGNKVTHNSWSHTWLKEGAAVYCADYLYPALTGRKKETRAMIKEWLQYITSKPGGMVWAKDSANIERLFDGRLTYVKPAFIYRMLHSTVGDSVFFRALRNFLSDTTLAYGFAGPENLQRHFEKEYGHSLDVFFKQWVYGEGFPNITTMWKQSAGDGRITIKISQRTSHPSTSFFEMRLPVMLQGKGKQEMTILHCKNNGEVFSIASPGFVVQKIVIDPEQWFITGKNTSIQNNLIK
jgi:aminopeptidase N